MIEAVAQLLQGLEVLPGLPSGKSCMRAELELQSMLGGALFASKAWAGDQAVHAYARARELAEQLGDMRALIPILAGQFTYHIGQSQYSAARQIAGDLLSIGDQSGDIRSRLIGHRCTGVVLHWTGEFGSALRHLDRVLGLYDRSAHRPLASVVGSDCQVQAAFLSCWDLLILGYPEQANARFELGSAESRDISHKPSLGVALVFGAMFNLLRRDNATALQQSENTIALATERGFPHWLALGNLLLGAALTERGEAARGLALVRKGFSDYGATTASRTTTSLILNMTYYLALLAKACEAAGLHGEARDHPDRAIAGTDHSGERWFEPELHRLKGEWLLVHAPARHVEAEACFGRAVDLARRQNARFWELRAAVSLARLRVSRGQPDSARSVLAPVYAWFSEQYPLPDIQEAGALLAQLSG